MGFVGLGGGLGPLALSWCDDQRFLEALILHIEQIIGVFAFDHQFVGCRQEVDVGGYGVKISGNYRSIKLLVFKHAESLLALDLHCDLRIESVSILG